MQRFSIFLIFLISCIGCGSEGTNMPNPTLPNQAEIIILNSTIFEGAGASTMQFEVRAENPVETVVEVTYEVKGETAEPEIDFSGSTGIVEIVVGESKTIISIPIINDELNEIDEKFTVTLSEAKNASIKTDKAIGIIKDDDQPVYGPDGYSTPSTYYGYNLEWSDEFEGTELDLNTYSYDLGDGCPNLCGWGNNELEWYTDDSKNHFFEDGKLIIRAVQEGTSDYTSTKIHTKDKQNFHFGRIDIRAKLPEGQGLWPAIWLLGNNIDAVGWPACGEIDIMELVGQHPNVSHGTAHWGPQGGGNKSSGSAFSLNEKFSENFHVFSLVWEFNEMHWYVDETLFHTVTVDDMQGETYRFNQAFYMILNVAVGGNWPGSPDDTTLFPQQMEVDYIRYFK